MGCDISWETGVVTMNLSISNYLIGDIVHVVILSVGENFNWGRADRVEYIPFLADSGILHYGYVSKFISYMCSMLVSCNRMHFNTLNFYV